MQEIIQPIERELLKEELKLQFLLRTTSKAGNLIYDFTAHDAPNLMQEIGRLREISYRNGGGASGNEVDLDDADTGEIPYHQLIVWDPDAEEIVGGYRYLNCAQCSYDENGQPRITSAHLFHYSETFIREYLPYTLELGRAFVQPQYQSRQQGMKAIYALDNLWDGIGTVLYKNPEIRYLIGKVTIYPSFDDFSRDLIYAYLARYHQDEKALFSPYCPIILSEETLSLADEIFEDFDRTTAFHALQRVVRGRDTTIPPMFNAYLNLTDSLKSMGNAVNDELANVYESGILVAVQEIYDEKKERYIRV